jgi:hypothetical protein
MDPHEVLAQPADQPEYGQEVADGVYSGKFIRDMLAHGDTAVINLGPLDTKETLPLRAEADTTPLEVLATVSVGDQRGFSGGTSRKGLKRDLEGALDTFIVVRGAHFDGVRILRASSEDIESGQVSVGAEQLSEPISEKRQRTETRMADDKPGDVLAKTWFYEDRGNLMVSNDGAGKTYAVVVQGNRRRQ